MFSEDQKSFKICLFVSLNIQYNVHSRVAGYLQAIKDCPQAALFPGSGIVVKKKKKWKLSVYVTWNADIVHVQCRNLLQKKKARSLLIYKVICSVIAFHCLLLPLAAG